MAPEKEFEREMKYDGIKRKLMIVIEDDGAGKFQINLKGDKQRIGKIPEMELGSAEFWAYRLFLMCGEVVRQAGALDEERTFHG